MNLSRISLGAVAGLVALGLAGTGLVAQEQEPQEQQQEQELAECKLHLEPGDIEAQKEPVEIQVAFEEKIGTTSDVEADAASGLKILKVERPVTEMAAEGEKAEPEEEEPEFEAAGEEPVPGRDVPGEIQYDLIVRLDASQAQAGNWELRFIGTEGSCRTQIEVEAAETEAETEVEQENPEEPPAHEGAR